MRTIQNEEDGCTCISYTTTFQQVKSYKSGLRYVLNKDLACLRARRDCTSERFRSPITATEFGVLVSNSIEPYTVRSVPYSMGPVSGFPSMSVGSLMSNAAKIGATAI